MLQATNVIEDDSPGVSLTAPADGRLWGPDYLIRVSGVAWPASAGSSDAPITPAPGSRLVVFRLRLTVKSQGGLIGPAPPALSAVLNAGADLATVDLSNLEQTAEMSDYDNTAFGSFVAAVPAAEHHVSLTMTDGTLSQSFDLWDLKRVTPYPAILYRNPNDVAVSDPAKPAARFDVYDQADDLHSPQSVTLHSATLTYVDPDGSTTPPGQAHAYLVLDLQGDYIPVSAPNLGDAIYLHGFGNMPAGALSLDVPGAAPQHPRTTELATINTDANDDDLFDETYYFVVPVSFTTATLVIDTSDQFQALIGGSGSILADPVLTSISAPISLPIRFPALAPAAAQTTPPWQQGALPTGYASPLGTPHGAASDYVIWIALLVLAGLAALATPPAVRHRQRRRALPPSRPPAALPGVPRPLALGPAGSGERAPEPFMVHVIGPVRVTGWPAGAPKRRGLEELLVYLALHNDRPRSADEIQLALWPIGTKEAKRKSLQNYLSELRQAIGADLLPEADANGAYRLSDAVGCDWARYRELCEAAAEAPDDEVAIAKLYEAMNLVRDRPFAGVNERSRKYAWAFTEDLHVQMDLVIISCARALAAKLHDQRRFEEAEQVARTAQSVGPADFHLNLARMRAARATANTDLYQRADAHMRANVDERAATEIYRILRDEGH